MSSHNSDRKDLAMKVLAVDEQPIHYWTNKATNKPPLILLHGWRGNHKGLVDLGHELRDYHIIIPDLPGFGSSPPLLDGKAELNDYTDFLAQFINELRLKPAILVGHSYGACLAFMMIARHPQIAERLVMIAPPLSNQGLVSSMAHWYFSFATRLPTAVRERFVKNKAVIVAGNRTQLRASVRGRRREMNQNDIEELQNPNTDLLIDVFMSFFETEFLPIARQVKCPNLIIAGGKDWYVTPTAARSISEQLTHNTLMILPNSAHLVVFDEPILTGKTIGDWLASPAAAIKSKK